LGAIVAIAFVEILERDRTTQFSFTHAQLPGQLPLLLSVSDWFENASCDQIAGFEQGEATSVTVVLDNGDKLAERALIYPVRARARLVDALGVEVLSGEVVRATYGATIQLTVEA
jgi:hypothetical protein